jgi:hypothetical protein
MPPKHQKQQSTQSGDDMSGLVIRTDLLTKRAQENSPITSNAIQCIGHRKKNKGNAADLLLGAVPTWMNKQFIKTNHKTVHDAYEARATKEIFTKSTRLDGVRCRCSKVSN